MKTTNKIRSILNRMANNAKEQRKLNKMFLEEMDRLGVDTDCQDFADAMAYVEGDCDTTQIIKHLEDI